MENNQYSCINRRFYASIFCALFSTLLFAFEGDIVSHLNFKKLPALNNLPTDEIQKVYQDKDGFIWPSYVEDIMGPELRVLSI